MKRLESLIDKVNEAILENSGYMFDKMNIFVSVDYKHYTVEADVDDYNRKNIVVYNNIHLNREYPNIEAKIAENIWDWSDLEEESRINDCDEYQRNGFSSEADYWSYIL